MISWITFFTSTSTLICCALPSLFVALGAGSALVTLWNNIPWILVISENKEVTWIVSGLLLIGNFIWILYQRNLSCPIDIDLAKKCMVTRKFNFYLWLLSLGIYLIGVGMGAEFLS